MLTDTERIDRAGRRKAQFEALSEGEKEFFAHALVGASYLDLDPFDIAMSYVVERRAHRSAA